MANCEWRIEQRRRRGGVRINRKALIADMAEKLLDAAGLKSRIATMARALAAMVTDPDATAMIGIRTRGALLAQRIHKIFTLEYEWAMPVGILDITLYRDDLSQLGAFPLVRKTHLDFDLTGRLILLIDDVLYTGRTVRSALDEIVDFGRPQAVRLAVLVDRGGREYPIQPDYAALTVQTDPSHVVKVCLNEVDGEEKVLLAPRPFLPPEGPM
jgi:pyrimidine operon attenuation protein/uracil phosphoribosyltransferase